MDHSTNKMTMSRQCAPKEILKKELSSREYSLFEEWAPDTLKTYSASIPPPATQTEDHQRQTISPVNVQGYPNSPRRMQMRSSSLFEEWKALALRGTDKLKTGSISPFTPKDTNVMGGSCFAMEGKGSMRNYARDGENDEIGPTNERCPRYPGANKKCEGFSIGDHTQAYTNVKSNQMMKKNRKRRSRGWKGNKQEDQDSQQHNLEEGYMAPNGSLISKEELVKLSAGLRLDNTDTVYFLPSFIEEPWKGMKAVPAFPQA